VKATDELRRRLERNLAAFERSPAPAGELRQAAVAVVIVAGGDGEACFVLTERASGLRHHAGQWALPGGRMDPGESVLSAALRELEEEIGLRLESSALLGRLDDYGTRSGFVISPVVLWGGDAVGISANPHEVAAVHLFPLSRLDHRSVPRLTRIPESPRPVIEIPLGGSESVFAPTGAVLYQLREVGLHGRPTRVAHFDQPVFAWR
jgi:8-oxo-dGTP pyrophosphatase MutT (NUDIX family)